MLFSRGQVVSVRTEYAGDALTVDAALSATTLTLATVFDFDEVGGTLDLNGATLTYVGKDDATSTLTLAAPLAVAADAGSPVRVLPLAPEKVASVLQDGEGEAVPARVPHHLKTLLPDGVRDPDEQESVSLLGDDEELVVFDVISREPVIDLSYGDPDTLPDKTPVAPASSPTPQVMGMYSSILASVPGVTNATPVLYEWHIALSDASPPVQGGATMAFPEPTPDVGVEISNLPGGVDYAATYYVAVWAKSDAEYAPAPSAWVPVQLNQLVSANFAAGSITAVNLAAVITLTSLLRTAETGQRVEIDVAGIRVYDSSGALKVNLSPTEVVILADRMYALYLETGGATLGGLTYGPAGGSFELGQGTLPKPMSALASVETVPLARFALAGTANGQAITDETAAYWWRPKIVKTATGSTWSIVRTSLDGTTFTELPVHVTSTKFILRSAAMSNSALWQVYSGDLTSLPSIARSARPSSTTFSAPLTTNAPAAPGTGGYAASEPIIGLQRTTGDLLVAHRVQGAQSIGGVSYNNNDVMVRKYAVTTPGSVLTLTLSQTIKFGTAYTGTLVSVVMDNTSGVFDLAASSGNTAMVVTARAPGAAFNVNNRAGYVPNAGSSVAATIPGGAPNDWYSRESDPDTLGTLWDGSAFWGTEPDGATLRKFASSSDASNDRWHTYTYYNGTQESMMATPVRYRTLSRLRERWTVPHLPVGVTQVRLYMANGPTLPARTSFERISAFTGTAGAPLKIEQNPITPPTLPTLATNPPPNTSNFPGGSGYEFLAGGVTLFNSADTRLATQVYVNDRGYSDQVQCTANATPTSTANVAVTGFSITITSPGTSAVYLVTMSPVVGVNTAGTQNVVEMLVDGATTTLTAATPVVTQGPAGLFASPSKTYRITGLSAGSHTFTARTRNSAGSTSATVYANLSAMHLQRVL